MASDDKADPVQKNKRHWAGGLEDRTAPWPDVPTTPPYSKGATHRLSLSRALMALGRVMKTHSGTAGHLSEKDRAARYPAWNPAGDVQ
jgi:hypothetical protein